MVVKVFWSDGNIDNYPDLFCDTSSQVVEHFVRKEDGYHLIYAEAPTVVAEREFDEVVISDTLIVPADKVNDVHFIEVDGFTVRLPKE